MDVKINVTLTDDQKQGIEAIQRLTGSTETADELVSRVTQKMLTGWADTAFNEFRLANQGALDRLIRDLVFGPRSRERLAYLGVQVSPNGNLIFQEPSTVPAQSGLDLGRGEFIGTPLAQAKKTGHDVIRIDLQRQSAEHAQMLAKEVLDHGMQPLCVVRSPDQIFPLPVGSIIELGGDEWDVTSFVAAATDCIKIVGARPGARLFLGAAIMDARGFGFLSQLPWKDWPEVGCIVFRASAGDSPHVPSLGWPSREAEVETLKAIVGPRPLGVIVESQDLGWEHKFFSSHGFEIVTGVTK